MRIALISTGGTIEKTYDELDAEFHLTPTAIPREAPHLARLRLHEDPSSLAPAALQAVHAS